MEEFGVNNPAIGVATIGLGNAASVRYNLGEGLLYEESIRRGEAELTADGALRALTGQHTGRSAKDKFVVRDGKTDGQIWWDNNKPLSPEHFSVLHQDMLAHAAGKDIFVQDLIGGADKDNALPTRVVTEFAWHSLFIRNLLIRPDRSALAAFVPKLTIIDLPSFRADPDRHGCRSETVIACDLTNGIVLIGGTSYAGEMKKSVFTVLNYLLPPKGVMPMHCSANVGPDGDAAVFHGLRWQIGHHRAVAGLDVGRLHRQRGLAQLGQRAWPFRLKLSRRSTPRPSVSARFSKTSFSTKTAFRISTMAR